MIIVVNKEYATNDEVTEQLSPSLTNLCYQQIKELPYGAVKSATSIDLNFAVKVAGEWLYATLYFNLREYEVMTIDSVTIASDTLDDCYGHDNVDDLIKEFGNEVQFFETLTEEDIKKQFEVV